MVDIRTELFDKTTGGLNSFAYEERSVAVQVGDIRIRAIGLNEHLQQFNVIVRRGCVQRRVY
jgi:environmental stress-induced protein Ves